MGTISNRYASLVELLQPPVRKLRLTLVKDSLLKETQRYVNYGTAQHVRTTSSSDGIYATIYSFKGLDQIPETSKNKVFKAVLRLSTNYPADAELKTYKYYDDDWSENFITYDNAPKKGDFISDASASAKSRKTDIDVLSAVQERVNAKEDTIGFYVTSDPTDTSLQIDMKENRYGSPAVVEIYYFLPSPNPVTKRYPAFGLNEVIVPAPFQQDILSGDVTIQATSLRKYIGSKENPNTVYIPKWSPFDWTFDGTNKLAAPEYTDWSNAINASPKTIESTGDIKGSIFVHYQAPYKYIGTFDNPCTVEVPKFSSFSYHIVDANGTVQDKPIINPTPKQYHEMKAKAMKINEAATKPEEKVTFEATKDNHGDIKGTIDIESLTIKDIPSTIDIQALLYKNIPSEITVSTKVEIPDILGNVDIKPLARIDYKSTITVQLLVDKFISGSVTVKRAAAIPDIPGSIDVEARVMNDISGSITVPKMDIATYEYGIGFNPNSDGTFEKTETRTIANPTDSERKAFETEIHDAQGIITSIHSNNKDYVANIEIQYGQRTYDLPSTVICAKPLDPPVDYKVIVDVTPLHHKDLAGEVSVIPAKIKTINGEITVKRPAPDIKEGQDPKPFEMTGLLGIAVPVSPLDIKGTIISKAVKRIDYPQGPDVAEVKVAVKADAADMTGNIKPAATIITMLGTPNSAVTGTAGDLNTITVAIPVHYDLKGTIKVIALTRKDYKGIVRIGELSGGSYSFLM